jgi:hypothetical protein
VRLATWKRQPGLESNWDVIKELDAQMFSRSKRLDLGRAILWRDTKAGRAYGKRASATQDWLSLCETPSGLRSRSYPSPYAIEPTYERAAS